MAGGIASKSGQEAQRDALAAEVEGLRRKLGEQDEVIGYLGGELARREAAQAPAPPSPAAAENADSPENPQPPPDPAAAEDTDLHALALVARMPGAPEKGSRRFWRGQVDRLGRHLAPDAHPAVQQRAALADPRGRAFVEALQSCRE